MDDQLLPPPKKKKRLSQIGCLSCLEILPLGPNPIPVIQIVLYGITVVFGMFVCIPMGITLVSITLANVRKPCCLTSQVRRHGDFRVTEQSFLKSDKYIIFRLHSTELSSAKAFQYENLRRVIFWKEECNEMAYCFRRELLTPQSTKYISKEWCYLYIIYH